MLMVQDVDLTPNPQALKFILNENLLNRETRSFLEKSEAESDPLAKGIFNIGGIKSVFYMERFITIEKEPDASWGNIQMPFVNFIKAFNKNLIPPENNSPESIQRQENDSLRTINDILDKRVRPALAGDGGGLEVLKLEGNRLFIRYQGACGTCPSAIQGTLVAIENLLRRELNDKIEVVSG